jgi:protein-S-isoprenylcysteine O-methyltransferase Ste14
MERRAQAELTRLVYGRAAMAIVALFAMFFLPAGTFAYGEAWGYLAVLLIPMFVALHYLLRNAPDLLRRRMQMREKEAAQKLIVKLSYPYFLLAFVLPGFDYRWGWSHVPVLIVVIADILVALGYGLVLLVFRENRYASRIIEVAAEQTVISSGPYALVRHPMYLGVTVMYLASPLALGSYWALLPAAAIVPILVARIINEEAMLERELKGYREYMEKTRYRLIPGVW